MKRLLLILSLLVPAASSAQTFYLRGSRNVFRITAEIVDSLSSEPVAFSSVYLRPVGDTLITHFTLSDQKGKAVLDDVTRGEYTLNVEFLGYKPYRKKIYFSESKNLGKIKMQEDSEQLASARVSAAVAPMEIKQDTIVYNAAAFHVEENDVLKDLLKKMPGVEVGEDGSVTVQGESVQKITVNGRTFFTGSNSAALDNLPAKAVNKIQVTNYESEKAALTGIRQSGREGKTMDVGLKQEYSNGTFGRIGANAGASIPGKGQDPMLSGKPFLWNVSGMLSAFGKQDQVTLIARGQNVEVGEGRAPRMGGSGLTTSGQAGVNWTTDRISGYETAASVYYDGRSLESGSRSSTVNYPASGEEILSDSRRAGTSGRHKVDLSASINPSRSKASEYYISFAPRFSYARGSSRSSSSSNSLVGGEERNRSEALSTSFSDNFGASGYLSFIRPKIGKERRSMHAMLSYDVSKNDGTSTEHSSTWMASGDRTVLRDLNYLSDGISGSASLSMSYIEPISTRLFLQTQLESRYQGSHSKKDASNLDGTRNDYYSTLSNRNSFYGKGNLLAQYALSEKKNMFVQVGASVDVDNIVTYSLAQNKESLLGQGEWMLNVAPSLIFFSKRLTLQYYGRSSQPSHSQMMSLLDISDPTRISTGNIYLKPSFTNNVHLDYHLPYSPSMRTLAVGLSAVVTSRPQVTASWFDASSVRYSVPVMAGKPTISIMPRFTLVIPLDKKSRLRMSLSTNGSYSRMTNYQASGILSGIDTDTFNYDDFMRAFWGGETGERFYSGDSGFRESLTHRLSVSQMAGVSYSGDAVSAHVRFNANGNMAWYTLDSQANSNTWVVTALVGATWKAPLDFRLGGDYQFSRYFGYSDGFSNATHHLNVRLTKSIKAFTLSLQGLDLLNQGISIVHNVDSDSVSDSYSLSQGRRVLFGVTWNFGRMNARNSQTAEAAEAQMNGWTRGGGERMRRR